MLRRVLLFDFVPERKDLGLVAMRLIVAVSIFLKHGYEKLFTYSATYAWLARSHHYVSWLGVGPSLFYATLSDGILTVLLAFGFATRWCALLSVINLAGAWSVLGFPYFGHQAGTDGELIIIYIASLMLLFFIGGGRYSVDHLLERETAKGAQSNVPGVYARG